VKRIVISLAGVALLYVGALGTAGTQRPTLMLLGLGLVGVAYFMKGPR
jgi:hypothetical protein